MVYNLFKDAEENDTYGYTKAPNFYFIFYSERMETMWILSSQEFLEECVTNRSGKNAGKHSIWFNGRRTNPTTGEREEYCKERFEKYICTDFSRFT